GPPEPTAESALREEARTPSGVPHPGLRQDLLVPTRSQTQLGFVRVSYVVHGRGTRARPCAQNGKWRVGIEPQCLRIVARARGALQLDVSEAPGVELAFSQ